MSGFSSKVFKSGSDNVETSDFLISRSSYGILIKFCIVWINTEVCQILINLVWLLTADKKNTTLVPHHF